MTPVWSGRRPSHQHLRHPGILGIPQKHLRRCPIAELFSWAVIQLLDHPAQLGNGDLAEGFPFPSESTAVSGHSCSRWSHAARNIGITEERRRRHCLGHGLVLGEFRPIVQRDGLDSAPTRFQ